MGGNVSVFFDVAIIISSVIGAQSGEAKAYPWLAPGPAESSLTAFRRLLRLFLSVFSSSPNLRLFLKLSSYILRSPSSLSCLQRSYISLSPFLSLIAFKGRLPHKAEFMSIENLKTFGKPLPPALTFCVFPCPSCARFTTSSGFPCPVLEIAMIIVSWIALLRLFSPLSARLAG